MKIYIYITLMILFTGFVLQACEDDDETGKVVNISIKQAVPEAATKKAYITVTEGQPLQLEAFIMPEAARSASLTYSFAGESAKAIELTEDGLITPLLKTPAEGDIPSPLGTDTIMVTANDGSGVFVTYPVRVLSSTILISNITLSEAQLQLEKGQTIDLSKQLTITPKGATNQGVDYESDDTNIATVDESGVVTAVGEIGQSTAIFITAKDRGKVRVAARVTIVDEAPLYVIYTEQDKINFSSNLATKEGEFKNLLDNKNSSFWAPAIVKRPIYTPACWLDIDLGEVIKFGQLGYRHRNLNYAHMQCHTFKLQGKKAAGDQWTDLGEFVTEAKQVTDYQLFSLEEARELRYLRINFIKGHLKDGATDWNYEDDGNVSVGDLQFYIYNR